jgi:hypothetical protein
MQVLQWLPCIQRGQGIVSNIHQSKVNSRLYSCTFSVELCVCKPNVEGEQIPVGNRAPHLIEHLFWVFFLWGVLAADAKRTITNTSVHAVLKCPKTSVCLTPSWVIQSSNSAHYFWVILGVETGRIGVFDNLLGLKTSSGMVCDTVIAVTTVARASTPPKRQAPWLHSLEKRR